ncbi:hypothetical protein N7468_008454 [Penicillium chermesinum]|uniref:Enoyl-CoA hydratase n=1 Tax=Penicillium chermesinum TaxID=63820 RepID=A0A9W9NPV2_9EURO|nr:uncharacterized protein N7468_008454 [Penicillium chermesinum]KAJ5223912.1 hypothetical protein N7468_008454 [Penicillium chermesinum]
MVEFMQPIHQPHRTPDLLNDGRLTANQTPPQPASSSCRIPSQGSSWSQSTEQNSGTRSPSEAHWEGHNIFSWFDEEPTLLVAIVTGAGEKAFCAGQDLVEQASSRGKPKTGAEAARRGKKPVLAAVNGFALGGGFEICLNCDMIVASPKAQFGLPEVAVGLYAAAGGLPRLVRIVGLPLASEFAMTGRKLSAKEALDLGLINRISQSAGTVVEETIALAQEITKNSPDGVIVTRQGIREAWGQR